LAHGFYRASFIVAKHGGSKLARWYRAASALLMVALALGLLLPSAAAVDKAPNVALVDVDGVDFNLTDYRGEVLVLDFMSLTCEPCKELANDTIHPLDRKGIDDVNILAIDVDPILDNAASLRDYATSHGYGWRFALDKRSGDAKQAFAVVKIPKLVVIDREGYVIYETTSLISLDTLRDQVDAALSGEAEPIDLARIGLVGFALFAGFASFFSPCSFPLLPGYITFYFKSRADTRVSGAEGVANKGAGRSALAGLRLGSYAGAGVMLVFFVIGVIVLGLVAIGVSVSGGAIAYLKPVVGIILLVMGLLTVLDVPINTGYITAPFTRLKERMRPSKGPPKRPSTGPAGLFLYGVAYGSASAACSVPVFIALVAASVVTGNPMDALVTFVVFLLSLWLLMAVMTAVMSVGEERVKRGLMRHYVAIKKVTGAVFIIAGSYLLWLFLKGRGIL
jgi:cytochrome c-type biogenesis protein